MQAETVTQELITLLQQAGALPAEIDAQIVQQAHQKGVPILQAFLTSGLLSCEALQELLLRLQPDTPPDTAAELLPALGIALPTGTDLPLVDLEYPVDDQQLQAAILAHESLSPTQLQMALHDQQRTGHPLWRTLLNLGLLLPQDITFLMTANGATLPRVLGQDNKALVPRYREAEWQTINVDETATAVQLVNTILEGAVRAGATDIHIEPHTPRMRVRYRIDGLLFDVLTVPQALEMPIISRLKILADMNITERRLPQDGRIAIRLVDQEYNLRVATIPTVHGEKLVLRLLVKSNVLTGLKQLGLEPEDEQRLRSLIAKPQGMILVTGPIGSGKTTTLYAALNEVNVLTRNIITIEDPVEYQLVGINQLEVDTKIGLTFATGLRSILRQDADIMMVGEIRDIETATVAVRAALTGQQLFSTLHTIDTLSAITTLENFGIQPYLLSSALSGVVAQRLVRRICEACKQWYTPNPVVLRQLGLPTTAAEARFAYGVGCPACYHTGYRGRTGLFEILLIHETLRRLIMERASEQELKTVAIREGMNTLQQNGLKKILQGITTPQEVMREVYL